MYCAIQLSLYLCLYSTRFQRGRHPVSALFSMGIETFFCVPKIVLPLDYSLEISSTAADSLTHTNSVQNATVTVDILRSFLVTYYICTYCMYVRTILSLPIQISYSVQFCLTSPDIQACYLNGLTPMPNTTGDFSVSLSSSS